MRVTTYLNMIIPPPQQDDDSFPFHSFKLHNIRTLSEDINLIITPLWMLRSINITRSSCCYFVGNK